MSSLTASKVGHGIRRSAREICRQPRKWSFCGPCHDPVTSTVETVSSFGGIERQHLLVCRSITSAVEGIPLPKSVREAMKSTILEEVTKPESRAWSDKSSSVGTKMTTTTTATATENSSSMSPAQGINDQISDHTDPLDDLYIEGGTRFWPELPPSVSVDADPFRLSQTELEKLTTSMREQLLGTDHPVLNQAAAYFFGSADGGKKVRPIMVMLLSRALADTMDARDVQQQQQPNVTTTAVQKTNGLSQFFTDPLPWQRQDLPDAQRRLAEIAELIHTASLFHDDVIDGADTRRGMPAVHMVFGNKMAILAGDFLLARASVALSRLRNLEVVETMSTIIEHLVRGEVMQMRGSTSSDVENERLMYYLQKNFYKTGSLMANSCKSAALLAGCPQELVSASYNYGKHIGMAFQLVDDALDFEGTVASMGKPALSDLRAGLATAPVLFAAEEFPDLEPLILRKFKEPGDVDFARTCVFDSDGLLRTKHLARLHAELAMESILDFQPGPHRDALVNMAYKIVSRTK